MKIIRETDLFHGFVLTTAVMILSSGLAAQQPRYQAVRRDSIVDIADRNQIFIDGRYLAAKRNVRIIVCPPMKTNERCLSGRLGGYSSIMEPDGVFRW